MLEKFIDHFASGGFSDYKEAANLWIEDASSTVRSRFVFKENNRNTPGETQYFVISRNIFDGRINTKMPFFQKYYGELAPVNDQNFVCI